MKDNLLFLHERKEKSRVRYGKTVRNSAVNGFKCSHCHGFVTADAGLSGVQNRNHCPYCLWSRHLDLYAAGDRLSACKGLMQPIGLTIKNTGKKYGSGRGELMLIHACKECSNLSINRIAADDNPENIYAVFEASFQMERFAQDRLESAGIGRLGKDDKPLIRLRLFGKATGLAQMLFRKSVIETV